MKRIIAAGLLLAPLCQVGCASLFTGTSQKVVIETEPEGATTIVIGSSLGSLLVAASKASTIAQKIFDILDPVLSPETRELLRKIDINELIAFLVMKAKLDHIPPEAVETAKEVVTVLEKLPINIVEKVMDMLGVQDFGVAPLKVELKKGKAVAVIAWAKGHKARVEVIDLRFNFVVLLNIFNLFLGVPIDIITGAWFNLEDKVKIRLRKRE